MANSDSAKSATDRQHESYADDAKAQRVLMVGDDSLIIDSDWDGTYNAIAVTDGRMITDVDDDDIAKSQVLPLSIIQNYCFDTTEDTWNRVKNEYDNDDIPGGQTTQLVIPLNYYWEFKSNSWKRWQGDSGSMWTTIYGMYTPLGDSVMDDTLNTIKVSNDTAVNLKVDGSDVTQPVSATDLDIRDLTSVSDSIEVLQATGTNLHTVVDSGSVDATCTATDFDIRDLTNASDSVEVFQSTAANLKVDGSDVTQPISGTVTANAGTNLNTSALALESSQGQWRGVDSGLTSYKEVNEKPRVSCTQHGYEIGKGYITGVTPFLKIGYNPSITNVEEDVWSYGGKYPFIKGESGLEVVSSDNTQDIGSILFNSTTTGGSTTTLEDTGVDFTAGGTPVAVFDCVILDKDGTTPEWGYVTAVTATTLTIANGFSEGGTADGRDYIILNKTAYTGAQAVHIHYLDSDFVEHKEIVILNGTTAVPTVNTDYYRINSMGIISLGTLRGCLGNIDIRDVADTPVYGRILAGNVSLRSGIYSVPANKTLYLNSWDAAWCSPNESKVQAARLSIEINMDEEHRFNTGDIFNPFAEVMVCNENIKITSDIPLLVPEKQDIIISCVSTDAAGTGPATSVLRGWLEDNA